MIFFQLRALTLLTLVTVFLPTLVNHWIFVWTHQNKNMMCWANTKNETRNYGLWLSHRNIKLSKSTQLNDPQLHWPQHLRWSGRGRGSSQDSVVYSYTLYFTSISRKLMFPSIMMMGRCPSNDKLTRVSFNKITYQDVIWPNVDHELNCNHCNQSNSNFQKLHKHKNLTTVDNNTDKAQMILLCYFLLEKLGSLGVSVGPLYWEWLLLILLWFYLLCGQIELPAREGHEDLVKVSL